MEGNYLRWIERGTEPAEIAGFAETYTQGWIDYYTNRDPSGSPTLTQPQDHEWSYYSETLGEPSNNNCWYCERKCESVGGWAPTVDHFRPRSLFPESTYAWSNWIFSCRRCNVENKQDRWPEFGFVDPTSVDIAERPEQYFDYDLESGSIIARADASDTYQQRAWATIDGLGLSEPDLVNPRFGSIRRFIEEFIEELLNYSTNARQSFIENFLALSAENRVAYLIFSALSSQQHIEYPGLKAMVAERVLRENEL